MCDDVMRRIRFRARFSAELQAFRDAVPSPHVATAWVGGTAFAEVTAEMTSVEQLAAYNVLRESGAIVEILEDTLDRGTDGK